MSVAREIAVKALGQARYEKAFVSDVLDDIFTTAPEILGLDRRLATQLALGVTRRRATLDALIEPFVNRSLSNVEQAILDVLHLGAYQMAFLDQIPPHAAVFETVALADAIGRPEVKGFFNGVLRRVCEIVTDDVVALPGRDTVPLETPEPRWRKLRQMILPNLNTPDYLAAAFSWPHWLAERWLKRHGFEECCHRGFWFNAAPPLWLRVNKRVTNRENYRLQLAASLLEAEPGEHPQSLHLLSPASVADLPGYANGDFSVQDHASMLVASALAPQPGQRILDLCAAPGGKTTHLAELMDNRGQIIACDIDGKRLDTVMSLAKRLKLTIIEPKLLSESVEPPPGPFDAALVDLPCSNTGVLGRRPEVRWRLMPREFEHLIRLQTRLLLAAFERAMPGGAIVYSTCSIEPDENERLIHGVCKVVKNLRLESEHHSIPGRPADGGYWARLRKTL
jgi:16S rRNA (cytosine967-C5)-methyltransferase